MKSSDKIQCNDNVATVHVKSEEVDTLIAEIEQLHVRAEIAIVFNAQRIIDANNRVEKLRNALSSYMYEGHTLTAVTDGKHSEGFCRTCADQYEAGNLALKNSAVIVRSETITFCVIEPKQPFICAVDGKFNIIDLEKIECDFVDSQLDYPDGTFLITYKPIYNKTQIDNSGFTEIEAYWDFTQVSWEPLPPNHKIPKHYLYCDTDNNA